MRAFITGSVTTFRYVDLPKQSGKVGQVDFLQAGTDRHPAKVLTLYIPNAVYCRLIAEQLSKGIEPFVTFTVYITHAAKDIEIEVLDMMEIASGRAIGFSNVMDPDITAVES
jgi:hypothetical protein